MEVKEASDQKLQAKGNKEEEEKLPKRSFKEVMRGKEKSKQNKEEEKTVFDFAREEEKRPSNPLLKEEEKGPFSPPSQVSLVAEGSSEISRPEEISMEISPLVEEMAHYIKIESDNGISTTTVEIALEGSVFHGTEVVIKHYDTNPHSFNLQLAGSPEAVELFAAKLTSLQDQLQNHEALKGFHVRIETPILTQKSNLREREKERLKKGYSPKVASRQKKMTS